MSRGIGKLQRDIIAAGRATRTIWDVLPSVPFSVAHDSPMPELRDTGNTWRTDGRPYFLGKAQASSFAEYAELRTRYRAVWPKEMDHDYFTVSTVGKRTNGHISGR